MTKPFARPALVLGLLSCIGPFAIDMYLPAMPAIAQDLGASKQAMQGTLTAYFAAFGVAQLVYGPWADQAGRKLPLYVGIAIFSLGSLLCALAPTVALLWAGRFVQGLGGAALMVVPRAIIRDLTTGNEATRMMATIMLVFSVSPMLAPLAGSALLAFFDWRAIFLLLLVAAAASLFLLIYAQPETLPPSARQRFHMGDTLRAARRLLGDRGFMSLTLLGAFGFSSFFVFLASAAFVYTEHYGLTPTGFSLAFAANAMSFIGASQLAGPLGARLGAFRLMRLATLGFAIFACLTLAVAVMMPISLAALIIGLALGNACLGMIIPTAMVMALDDHGDIAGLASSLGGTMQMLTGGVIVAALGPFFSASPTPMIAAIAGCALVAPALSRLTRPSQAALASPAG